MADDEFSEAIRYVLVSEGSVMHTSGLRGGLPPQQEPLPSGLAHALDDQVDDGEAARTLCGEDLLERQWRSWANSGRVFSPSGLGTCEECRDVAEQRNAGA